MTSTNKMNTRDRVYGEIYEANGIYWAEVIVIEDGLDYVVGKSADFATRKLAAAWLNERKVEVARTDDDLIEALASISLPALWNRVRNAFNFGNKLVGAN